jgi:hypothetical protein
MKILSLVRTDQIKTRGIQLKSMQKVKEMCFVLNSISGNNFLIDYFVFQKSGLRN